MSYYYLVKSDKTATLAYPHYSDPAFQNEVTIFGQKAPGLQYAYADRLIQWDSEAHERGRAAMRQSAVQSVHQIEVYLSAYYQRPVEVVHVLANAGRFDGHPYWCYGFRFEAKV